MTLSSNSSDMSTVKAEIKAWERAFKLQHAREPTVDDIRQHPDVASKYKLYKKLTKTVSSDVLSVLRVPSRASAAQTTAPLTTFNPFSPRKNNQKLPAADRSPSRFTLVSTKPNVTPHARPSSPVSRARKRLRGDPVSPSPNKEKRPRLGLQRLPSEPGSSSSEDEDDAVIPKALFTNSPAKAPRGSKSFKLLFPETSTEDDPSTSLFVRTKDVLSTRGPSGGTATAASSGLDDDLTSDINAGGNKSTIKSFPFKPLSALPREDLTNITEGTLPTDKLNTRMSTKRSRPLSNSEDTVPSQSISVAIPSLLPPSPPPEIITCAAGKSSTHPKEKSNGRKKTKITEYSEGSGHSDNENTEDYKMNVKIVSCPHPRSRSFAPLGSSWQQKAHVITDLDPDLDPLLAHTLRLAPHGTLSSPQPSGADFEEERLEIRLPEQLRHVLALGPARTKGDSTNLHEEWLVKGLVTGTRVTHYDATKGGEIWDVGEDDLETRHAERGIEEDDEWEGQPVPWEVGEL